MVKEKDDLASAERRNFLKLTAAGGFTAAVVAGASGVLYSDKAAADTMAQERKLQKAAKHTMTIATAYVLGASRSYPIMQLDLKENIQNFSNGQIYVRLSPGGELGAGGALAEKVQNGTIQAAQHSLANFAPFASAVDLINLPYFCGANQRFVNLTTSDVWKQTVNPNIEKAGFKALFYVVIDPRTVAMRKGGKPVLQPSDLNGVKFRVPGSKIMQQYYQMVGANPTPVAWGETPSAIKQGVADALDPSVEALYVFGFKDILSSVTFTQFVPDAQVYSCNLNWYKSLSPALQHAVDMAAEVTMQENLAKVPAARAYAMYKLREAGVEFHTLKKDQLAAWQEKGGYQLSAWDPYKTKLAGSMDAFHKLEEAAGTQSRYYVNDA